MCCKLLLEKSTHLHLLPVLSDEGPRLIKFYNDKYLILFFCIRHITGKIGVNFFLGKLIGRLIMAQTEEEFNKILEENIDISNEYYKENKGIPEKAF